MRERNLEGLRELQRVMEEYNIVISSDWDNDILFDIGANGEEEVVQFYDRTIRDMDVQYEIDKHG